MKLPLASALLLLLAALAGGCASQAAKPEKGVIVSADQTEVVMPVGSHIRTRVLKGTKPEGASPVATASGEALNDALNSHDGPLSSVPVSKTTP